MAVQYKDYYEILGISRDASKDEIQRAYRKLAHKFHPDLNKEAGSEEKFKEINETYEVLKDPARRSLCGDKNQGSEKTFQKGKTTV